MSTGEEKGRVDAISPSHSSCRTEFRAGGHDVDKLDKIQERATHTQKDDGKAAGIE